MKNVAVIDMDLYRYHAAAAGERRTVFVKHKIEPFSVVVNNRTEWYGHWKKKDGGMLADLNAERESPWLPDDFTYEDIQTQEPIENILHSAKLMVEKDIASSGASSYIAYLGSGQSWRVERSTLLRYKGNRDNMLRPLAMQEVTEYLLKKFKARTVVGWENDDVVVMECYQDKEKFAIVEDKDFFGCPIRVWDRNQQYRGVVNCNKFGKLFKDSKGKIRGEGRLWLYHQVCSEDQTDNYAANCMSEVKWGEMSSFKRLIKCKDDKEAFKEMCSIYQHLYPEKKVVKGWRGDDIEIDWKYVLEENFQMARMYRFPDDDVAIIDVINRLED